MVLAEDVFATENHPQFRASTMDGFAVNKITLGTYRVADKSLAGGKHIQLDHLSSELIAVYVTTGA